MTTKRLLVFALLGLLCVYLKMPTRGGAQAEVSAEESGTKSKIKMAADPVESNTRVEMSPLHQNIAQTHVHDEECGQQIAEAAKLSATKTEATQWRPGDKPELDLLLSRLDWQFENEIMDPTGEYWFDKSDVTGQFEDEIRLVEDLPSTAVGQVKIEP